MESKARIAIKALTWQLLGLAVMIVIGFIFTGSVRAGGGIAIVSAVTGYLCYFGHEMIWSRIAWGRRQGLK
ncbi:DUF2061 domain-containing protein [Paracoccus homiensis]|uniref:Uncharacterized membrane protein n=1 Tax=Paracoccus homiensis TaxID=364199 RepID=A0A1I0DAP7_9RHOB|nr:DUF2061 domain-containing protein [Paracoccus homiensis]SET29175.1 Uncharacterized membrane protein [Paracoccus homiensis]